VIILMCRTPQTSTFPSSPAASDVYKRQPQGTPFQRQVWQILQTIPFGQTRSYAQIAAGVGRARAVRAVGAANGKNPLPIVIPCHRVIGSDGGLTGFAGGLAAKTFLLSHEGAAFAKPPLKKG